VVGLFFALLTPFQGGKDMGPVCCVRGWQGMGWGGGLILSKAQKSAATPTHPLLAYGFCSPTEELGFRVPFRCRKRAKCGHWPLTALEQLTLLLPAYRIYPPDMMQFTP